MKGSKEVKKNEHRRLAVDDVSAVPMMMGFTEV
jgi:hypothetical protein